MSEPWSSKQRSKKGRGRPLFGVNAVVCPKKKKVTKNARKKTKKDLTGPTLLEISDYATYQGLKKPDILKHKSWYAAALMRERFSCQP